MRIPVLPMTVDSCSQQVTYERLFRLLSTDEFYTKVVKREVDKVREFLTTCENEIFKRAKQKNKTISKVTAESKEIKADENPKDGKNAPQQKELCYHDQMLIATINQLRGIFDNDLPNPNPNKEFLESTGTGLITSAKLSTLMAFNSVYKGTYDKKLMKSVLKSLINTRTLTIGGASISMLPEQQTYFPVFKEHIEYIQSILRTTKIEFSTLQGDNDKHYALMNKTFSRPEDAKKYLERLKEKIPNAKLNEDNRLIVPDLEDLVLPKASSTPTSKCRSN